MLIRESKFGKSRLVPLHPTSMQALEGYARLRDQLQAAARRAGLFVSLKRKRLLYAVVQETFRQLIDNAGIGAGAPSPPRLHDFRHTFAVRTQVSGVAAAASFRRSGERTLPAVQRAVLGLARSHDGPTHHA